jgi:transposase
MEPYEPTHHYLCQVWKRLSREVRETRLADARDREKLVKGVEERPKKESERKAIVRLGGGIDRSSFRRWQKKWKAHGLDGLLDWRMPAMSPMPELVRQAICTLRRADPNLDVRVIAAHLAKHHGFEAGETTIKAVLRREGLSRRRGPASGDPHMGEVRLELAGMKLIEAACIETGYLTTLGTGIVHLAASTQTPSSALPMDPSDRDDNGRFKTEYNERYRKESGAVIGPGYASVETTRREKDPARFHLNHVGAKNIERKLWALLVSPLLGGGRWDGIRVSRGELLGELCGFPYMPATLDQFTRELKFLGVSSTLWEIHARLWLEQTKQWGGARSTAVLYVDETNKPVWTNLFSHASKVSNVGRVMPSLEVVAFHSGYGVPLWMVTHSGRAPLVRVVPSLLNQLEATLEGAQVGRLIVIDAEGNSIPFLKGLEEGTPERAWVTRLRPSWVEGKAIFNRTNYRPYRDGDRIRIGVADFNDPDGGMFRMRVIEIERRSKGTVTYLGASLRLLEREWSAIELADVYFDRWPNQEANFRAVNQAVGSKDVHGYGKQWVDNVTVVTEIDKLQKERVRLQAAAEQQQSALSVTEEHHKEDQKILRRREGRQETLTRSIDANIATGARLTPALQRLSAERASLTQEIGRRITSLARRSKSAARQSSRLDNTRERIDAGVTRQSALESRKKIFRHDVELDSLFALLKVGLVLLVTFVLKEYLGDARMEPLTFLERLATLPGRLRSTSELDIVTFDYNQRDPDVMALLIAQCETINGRRLRTHSGRVLRIQVDPPPPPRRPPPPTRDRTDSRRRFSR